MPPIKPSALRLSIAGRRSAGLALSAIALTGAAVLAAPSLRAPKLELIWMQPTVLQIHILGAFGALIIGAVLMAGRKGRNLHRVLGWSWVVLMAAVAGSSLFIVGLNGDRWSYIHGLTGFTLAVLPLAVVAARRHRVRLHRSAMMGLFYGGIIVAGAFTFVPGRLMWTVFFG